MSMYGEYVNERLGQFIIETEQAFITYRYQDDKTVYIVDLYVRPESRKDKVASRIADLVVEEAKRKGCTRLLGSVVPSAKGSTDSLKVLLGYGMKLDSSANDFIIFSKEI